MFHGKKLAFSCGPGYSRDRMNFSLNSLLIGLLSVFCLVAQAIEPDGRYTQSMPKPDNAVNLRMAQAEDFPTRDWYDGKYWDIWGDKRAVPVEQPQLIWYALKDTPPSLKVFDGIPVDWTTDATGDILIFFLDTLGNWNCGYFVIYRRNEKDMFEYVGKVFTGSQIGWFDLTEIELQEDGFVLSYRNRCDLPEVQHKFLYDGLEDFIIPEHDFRLASTPVNDQGCHLVICREAAEPHRLFFRLEDKSDPFGQSRMLRTEDGSLYYLPELVCPYGEDSCFYEPEIFRQGFRWEDSSTFRTYGESGTAYTWQLLPEGGIRLIEAS